MLHNPELTAAAHRQLRVDLVGWSPGDQSQDRLRREYLDFIDSEGVPSLERSGGPEHLTASCFVFTPALDAVLLCFHKKGQFWVQLGGHIESGDRSVAEAAYREAVEEGGITNLVPAGVTPIDVDRHGLGDGFGVCAVHWDIGFVAFAERDAVPAVSDESEDVAWWPVQALPENVPPGFGTRVRGVLRELHSRGVPVASSL